MVLLWMIALKSVGAFVGESGVNGQNPNDPLVFGPGMRAGSRMQFGKNVVPSDWSYSGTFAERTAKDVGLKGFEIVTLSGPSADVKRVTDDKFAEVPCQFIGSTPVVTVFSQDGQQHRFALDSGSGRSYMRPLLAHSLNSGSEEPLPMCLYIPSDTWVHFKAEVDRSIAVLSASSAEFPVDGILGLNAVTCLQLKIDYHSHKLWARVSSKQLDERSIATELNSDSGRKPMQAISAAPITRQASGRLTVKVQFGDKEIPLELDTGASLLGLLPATISDLQLAKIGEGQVLIQSGTKTLSKYLATDVTIGSIKSPFAVVHEGVDSRLSFGGFGPSILPHHEVIIDFPGMRLLTIQPTADEQVAQVVGQLISSTVRIDKNEVLLDMPDRSGRVTRIQDQPISVVTHDLKLLAKGDPAARDRIISLYRSINSPKGHFSLQQNGTETTIEIGNRP